MKKENGKKPIMLLIIVLVILLAVSGTALAGTILYKYSTQSQGSPVVVPDNVITPEAQAASSAMPIQAVALSYRTVNTVRSANPKAMPMSVKTVSAKSTMVDKAEGEDVTLKLYKGRAEDSTAFHVENMFPGDRSNKSYRLEVSYKGSVTVHFHADIRKGYEKLAEVLKCKVSVDGTQLYDGLMKDMPESISHTLPQSSGTTADLDYDISVYLETSVGNEYMNKELYADFRWWVNEDGGGSDKPTKPTDPDKPTEPDKPTDPDKPSKPTEPDNPNKPDDPTKPTDQTKPGELIPPKTGDNSHVVLWISLAGLSLFLLILLLFFKKRKKEEDEDEQQ